MAQRKFDLVLVGYRSDDTEKSISFCDHAFGPRLTGQKILVLNNASNSLPDLPANDWKVARGSNTMAEFSGWQEGLDRREDRGNEPAGVIFVNDTVVTHRHFTLARQMAFVSAMKKSPSAALLGFKDGSTGKLTIGGLELTSWVSTYCFVLTTDALIRLNGRLYEPLFVERCVPGGLDETKFFADLSPDLDAHLRHWIFGGGWYGGASLGADNVERLTLKARCIIAEKLLSARCMAADVETVDPFERRTALRVLDRVQRRVSRSFPR